MIYLDREIKGQGSTGGYIFTRVAESPHAYVYEVNNGVTDKPRYEVFYRRTAPVRDFKNWNKTGEIKEVYPADSQFGRSAWHFMNKKESYTKFAKIVDKYDGE